jgi:hypothetical protein
MRFSPFCLPVRLYRDIITTESDQIYRILRNDALDIRQLKPLALAATLFAEPTADGSSDPKLHRPWPV